MSFENNFKQFLKESGRDDEKLSKKEMMDLQTSFNNSTDSAGSEDRDFDKQSEEMRKLIKDGTNNSSDKPVKDKPFTPKQWTKQQKLPDLFVSPKEFEITFQDMLESSKESLKIIYHNPIYALPIPTNPKYQKYSIEERTKMLYDYHTRVSELKMKLARKSLHRAPYPEPILSSNKCKNSLMKNASHDESDTNDEPLDDLPAQDVYVSRAGRQVKRKIYTEDPEFDSDPDFASVVKKNKSGSTETKITMDTPFIPEKSSEEKSSAKLKVKKDTPKSEFGSNTRKMGRSEILFENLMQEGAKKKQQEEEMANFEKTLPKLDEQEEDRLFIDDSPVKSQKENDEPFIRQRVVPPIPGRKGIRSKKQITQEDFDKIDIVPASPGSPVIKRYPNLSKSPSSITKRNAKAPNSEENLLIEESSSQILEKVDCPICGKPFLQSEIEDHASHCGIEDDIDVFTEMNTKKSEQITCHLCDTVFLVNTSYEVHVKQCIASKIKDL